MTQCLLRQGAATRVAWIPTVKANMGQVKIKDIDGVWNVAEKYSTEMASAIVDNSSDYRRHCQHTDVSTWHHFEENMDW